MELFFVVYFAFLLYGVAAAFRAAAKRRAKANEPHDGGGAPTVEAYLGRLQSRHSPATGNRGIIDFTPPASPKRPFGAETETQSTETATEQRERPRPPQAPGPPEQVAVSTDEATPPPPGDHPQPPSPPARELPDEVPHLARLAPADIDERVLEAATMPDPAVAEKRLRMASLNGWAGADVLFGDWLQDQDRAEDAARVYRTVARTDAVAANNLGVVLERLGHLAEAARAYRRAVALGSPEAEHNLGRLEATPASSR